MPEHSTRGARCANGTRKCNNRCVSVSDQKSKNTRCPAGSTRCADNQCHKSSPPAKNKNTNTKAKMRATTNAHTKRSTPTERSANSTPNEKTKKAATKTAKAAKTAKVDTSPVVPPLRPFIQNNMNRLNWAQLSVNPKAGNFIVEHANDYSRNAKLNNEHKRKVPNCTYCGNGPVINKCLIDWVGLSANPSALLFLHMNLDKIDLGGLSDNPNPKAIATIKRHAKKSNMPNWDAVLANPRTEAVNYSITFLEHPGKWGLDAVSSSQAYFSDNTNPKAIAYLSNHPRIIHWGGLSMNKSPAALALLAANPDKLRGVRPELISGNPANEAIELLVSHPELIHWGVLSGNPNPRAVRLIENRMNRSFSPKPKEKAHAAKASAVKSHVPKAAGKSNEYSERYVDSDIDDALNWPNLAANPSAVHLLSRAPAIETKAGTPFWSALAFNQSDEAMSMIETNLGKLDRNAWHVLAANPSALPLLKRHVELIDKFNVWRNLCTNPNRGVVKFLEEHADRLGDAHWNVLSANPAIM